MLKESRDGVERKYVQYVLKGGKVEKVEKTEITGAEKSKLFPTDIGALVTDFLMENFKDIMDFNFTADIEGQFDRIADGKIEWHKMIDKFYKPFHETVEVTTKEGKRASGERYLGESPAPASRLLCVWAVLALWRKLVKRLKKVRRAKRSRAMPSCVLSNL